MKYKIALVLLILSSMMACQAIKNQSGLSFSDIKAEAPKNTLVGNWSSELDGENTLVLKANGTGILCNSRISQIENIKYANNSIYTEGGSEFSILSNTEENLFIYFRTRLAELKSDDDLALASDYCKQGSIE